MCGFKVNESSTIKHLEFILNQCFVSCVAVICHARHVYAKITTKKKKVKT